MAQNKLSANFLGNIAEVCIVTPDVYKTMSGLCKLGIGPFQVFNFNSQTVSSRVYRGQDASFELKVCFAKQGSLVFELMQPVSGPSLMADYLKRSGGREGIQHVAFDCEDMPMAERKQKMKERGFEVGMEGVWKGKEGKCHFVFFDTEDVAGTVFETIDFSKDWEDPECEWFPRAPDTISRDE